MNRKCKCEWIKTYFNVLLLADGHSDARTDDNSILNGLFRIFVILISCTNACGMTRCAESINQTINIMNWSFDPLKLNNIFILFTVKFVRNKKVTAKTLKFVHNSIDIVDNDCMLCGERFGKIITGGWSMRRPYNGTIINCLRQMTSIFGKESCIVVNFQSKISIPNVRYIFLINCVRS